MLSCDMVHHGLEEIKHCIGAGLGNEEWPVLEVRGDGCALEIMGVPRPCCTCRTGIVCWIVGTCRETCGGCRGLYFHLYIAVERRVGVAGNVKLRGF